MFWKKNNKINLTVPASGKLLNLTEVPDEVFSQKMLGDGFAIAPESGEFCSPVDGVIETLFPTGHAFGVITDDGFEVLVHIGIDTVELKGKGFQKHVEIGHRVKAGDLVVTADLSSIKEAGKSVVTPIIFTDQYKQYKFDISKVDNGCLEVEIKA